MTEQSTTITIPMDDTTAAYYKGVAAGIAVDEAMTVEWAGQPTEQRRCVYWLLVGRRSTGIEDQKLLEAFTMGAAVRQPYEPEQDDEGDDDDD